MTPESGLPVVPYNAEFEGPDGAKDEYLLSLIEELEEGAGATEGEIDGDTAIIW